MQSYLKLLAAATLGAAAAYLAQERRIKAAHYDTAFGMLTRAGLDAKLRRLHTEVDVLFVDLDRIHELNEQRGYAEVDRLIRQAFALRVGDTIIGRHYSGDEIVVICRRGDGAGLAERLTIRLADFGLSATISVKTASPREAILRAANEVQAAKRNGVRGCVVGGGL